MKKTLMLMAAMAMLASCDDDNTPNDAASDKATIITHTAQESEEFVLKGMEDVTEGYTVLRPSALLSKVLYIKNGALVGNAYTFAASDAKRLDQMTEAPAEGWSDHADICDNSCYWARYQSVAATGLLKLRIAYVKGNNVGVEYVIAEQEKVENLANKNANNYPSYKQAGNLCMPAMDDSKIYREYFVSDAADTAVFNYALEWDSKMVGTNWVAYEYNSVTRKQKNINRSDNWFWDTQIGSTEQVVNSMHSVNGYDKGHICAAKDRDYSEEAKAQTFNYSNCFPQIGVNFNQGYWNDLENFVRTWCISTEYDHVYVTKGGTLNSLLKNYKGEIAQVISTDLSVYPETDANGYTAKGLPVPQYFYMAILAQKGENYKAIGFLVEHKEYPTLPNKQVYTGSNFKSNVVSIDELEKAIGTDLFCNLPDVIEDKVEASVNMDEWEW